MTSKNKSIVNFISNIDTYNKITISKQIKCQLIDNVITYIKYN